MSVVIGKLKLCAIITCYWVEMAFIIRDLLLQARRSVAHRQADFSSITYSWLVRMARPLSSVTVKLNYLGNPHSTDNHFLLGLLVIM